MHFLKKIINQPLYILIFFLLFSLKSNAQDLLENLEKEYNTTKLNDPKRFEIAAKYSQALYYNNKTKLAEKILNENIELSKKNVDGKNTAFLYCVLAINYKIQNNITESKKNFELAKKYGQRTNDSETLGYVSYSEGWLFSRNDQGVKAVESFLNAIKYYEKSAPSTNLNTRKSTVYKELATIYSAWNEYELQEKYSKKSLEHALLQKNPNIVFASHMSMGYMYEQQFLNNRNNFAIRDLAEKHYLEAINFYYKNPEIDVSNLSFAANNLANLYMQSFPENYSEKALEYAHLANKTALEIGELNHIASSYGLLSDIALNKKDYNGAKNHLLNALVSLQKSVFKDHNIELSIYESLADIEETQGNYKEALRYQKAYIKEFRYIFDEEKLEISKRLESQFEKELQKQQYEKLQLLADKKEQQISLMHSLGIQQEQEFNNLKLQEENQSKKLKLSELESQKRHQELKLSRLETQAKNKDLVNFQERLSYKEQINTYYVLLIIFFGLLIILILYSYKQRTKGMKQKESLYNLALEQEKQNSKISTLTALLEGQEKERGRLARDLHDGLGGLLSGTKLQLTLLNNRTEDSVKTDIQKSIYQIDGAVDELRRVAHNLMPDLLLKYGLEVALQEFATRMNNDKLEIDVQFLSFTNTLSQEEQLLVYRIIQELVNNAIKHANPSQIIIQVVEEDDLYLVTVEDDGDGFDLNDQKLSNSAGFHNIQSRVHFLKGTLNIQSQKKLGTSIDFQFPKK